MVSSSYHIKKVTGLKIMRGKEEVGYAKENLC